MFTDDASLVAMLFEAGQQEAVSSDAVMDVLVEALKTGHSVEEIIEDNEILSRKQREAISQVINDPSRRFVVRPWGRQGSMTRPPPAVGRLLAICTGHLTKLCFWPNMRNGFRREPNVMSGRKKLGAAAGESSLRPKTANFAATLPLKKSASKPAQKRQSTGPTFGTPTEDGT